MLFSAPRHVVLLIRSPIMTDAVWCTPTCGITYSVSHHDGCCLVHPDTWYHLFGSPIMSDAVWYIPTRGITYSVLPSCRMLFGTSRHVVLLIRFSHHVGCRLVHPDTWYYLFGSPIMTDAVWCTPTCGITYSVSHHDGCCLVHPDMWYYLFGSPIMTDAVWCIPTRGINYSVLPSCRMLFGTSRHVVSLIRLSHHVGCRLVHPDTWYYLFGSPIMSDAVWYIPTRGITYSVLPS